MLKKTITALLIFICISFLAFAQMNQTGSLKGTVFMSTDDSPLPGVLITLTSDKMVTDQMTTITNENGKFRFMGLYPGHYTLKFTLDGMKTIVRKGVKVEVGKTFTINEFMKMGQISENIMVEGQTPTIDSQTTTKSSNFDAEALSAIPAARTIQGYFNMTPGVNDGIAFGAGTRDSTFNLEGVNLNDPAVSGQGVYFGMDIMEEISITTGGLSAQYSSKGANINVVTKSGGNNISGSLSIYYRHKSLKSDNTKGTKLEGTTGGANYEVEPGISLGGPIIKNKLWFFGNFSYNKSETYTNGYPYDQDKEIPVDEYKPYPYIKLTYQPNQDNKISLSYNFTDRKLNHRGASQWATEESTWKQKWPRHVISAQWTRTFGSSFFANLKISKLISDLDFDVKSNNTRHYDAYTGYSWGNNARNERNPRNRFSVNVDGTLFLDNLMGSHEIMVGGEYMYVDSGRKVDVISSDIDPVSGWNAWYFELYNGKASGVEYVKDMNVLTDMKTIALFINDTWNVTDALTLNLGLRFTHQKGIIPRQGMENGGVGYIAPHLFGQKFPYDTRVEKEFSPLTWNDLAPRVSLIYDIFKDGKTLLNLSYCRYTGEMITDFFQNANPNGWTYYGGSHDANGQINNVWYMSQTNLAKYEYNGHKAKSPYADEFIVGIQRELTEDISVSARFLKKWYKRNIENVDANALNLDKLLETGELEWTNYEKVEVKDPHSGEMVTFWNRKELLPQANYYLNPKGCDRTFTGVELVLNKRYSNKWSFNINYVYSKSEGLYGTSWNATWGGSGLFNNPNAHVNAIGTDTNERRHMLKATGMLKLPLDFNIGFFAQFRSGRTATRTVSHRSLTGNNLSQGDVTNNAEKKGSYQLPSQFTLDLKLEKSFKFGKFNLRAFVDIFNVLNEGTKTGVWSDSSNQSRNKLWQMTAISPPRIVRIGTKIEF